MQKINIKDIKVVKLINGDDILCYLPTGTEQLPENGPLLRLVKPLQIRYVPSFTEEGLKDYIALSKWAAYTTDKIITIPKDKIMTVTNATLEMTRSWHNLSIDYENARQFNKGGTPEQIKLSDDENKELNKIFDEFDSGDGEPPTIH